MPKTPKSHAKENKDRPITEKEDEIDSWARDQEKHEYYYDDAHGYEKYEPEDDDEDQDRESPRSCTGESGI